MKRHVFRAFVAFPALASAVILLGAAACDPTLTPVSSGPGGDAGRAVDTADMADASPTGADAERAPEAGSEGDADEDAGAAHTIDGVDDFTAGETFATSSTGYDAFVSWDDKNLYFGAAGADVGGGASSRWLLIYVDGQPGNAGSAIGIAYDCSGSCDPQQAKLPFRAGYHVRWKADGSYTNLQKWTGARWDDVGPISTVAQRGTFMELSVARAALGNPTTLKVHMNMLVEENGAGWTYAGAPSTSFVDGKAPAAFAKYYEFDLANRVKAPNAYTAKP